MKNCLRGLAVAAMLLFSIGAVSCDGGKTSEPDAYFGTDLKEWNPLVIYAAEGEETPFFARDSSQISMVLSQFDEMTFTLSDKAYGTPAGIAFAIDTMRGRVELGRTDGVSLWAGGRRYELGGTERQRKAFIEELRRLYGLIRAETQGITEVKRETMLSVKPDMTYRELLDLFGKTLQTAVIGAENAFLYQLEGRPFYITFEKETDPVGVAGETLLEDLRDDYNLSDRLRRPEPLPGGRREAYIAAFRAYIADQGLTDKPVELELEGLPFTEEGDGERIAESLPVSRQKGAASLHIEAYYHMAEETMRFRIAGGEKPADVECVWEEGRWTAAVLPSPEG